MIGEDGEKGERRQGLSKSPGREALRPPQAKRFYKSAAIQAVASSGEGSSFTVVLDGRPVRTPRKRLLAVPSEALAAAIAGEWQRQGAQIDPGSMPLTRIVNTAIDAVVEARDAVANDIIAFLSSDLVCYRAEAGGELARRQKVHWDPILRFAEDALGARLMVREGVMHFTQPEAELERLRGALEPYDAFTLAALHVITTLTGSALLALSLAHGAAAPEAVWPAAHVDEDYQIELWGRDAEAEARRAARRAEFDAASLIIRLLAQPAGP